MFSTANSKGTMYYLHTKEVKLRGQSPRPIYFFSRDKSREGADPVGGLPGGMEVSETISGLPVLRRVR